MELNDLLELAKQRANLSSDYALAKVMGIERQIISQWKSGKRHPSNQEAIQLATLAGLEEMRVIAEIELRTANSEKKKEFWKSYIESRGLAHSLGTIALGLAIIATPEPAQASVLHLSNYDANFLFATQQEYTLCVFQGRRPNPFRLLILKAILCKLAALLPSYLNTKHRYAFP